MEKKIVNFQFFTVPGGISVITDGEVSMASACSVPCGLPMEERYYLGTGVFGWDRSERITDRYAAFYLIADEDEVENGEIPSLVDVDAIDEEGTMYAKVLDTRKSPHIGDLHHGIAPTTPNRGEVYQIARGKWKTDTNPYDDRDGVVFEYCEEKEGPRLPLEVLYTLVDQTVSLYFIPAKKEV